jgi:ferrochelatase
MEVHRSESLNESPIFIRALADIVSKHVGDYFSHRIGPTSVQLGLRCPGCKNATCALQKSWFGRGGSKNKVDLL